MLFVCFLTSLSISSLDSGLLSKDPLLPDCLKASRALYTAVFDEL